MDRNLIDYLPLFLHEYRELREITDTEQVNFNTLWQDINDLYDNQYVHDLTVYGVERWESILEITPRADDTLDDRKFKILAMINFSLPYTYRKLQEILTALCGADGFKTQLQHEIYELIVKLSLSNVNNYNDVSTLLRQVCPANLVINIYTYNIHRLLQPLTHGEMRVYTHDLLRTEIL